LDNVGITPEKIDMVVLSHELSTYRRRPIISHGKSSHRSQSAGPANKLMLRDDFSMTAQACSTTPIRAR